MTGIGIIGIPPGTKAEAGTPPVTTKRVTRATPRLRILFMRSTFANTIKISSGSGKRDPRDREMIW
jgi:hypothetical protein